MIVTKHNFSKINKFEMLSLFLIALYPLAIIVGNLFINLFILLLSISFLLNIKKNTSLLKQSIFYILVFFFISLIINLIFSTNFENSAPRVIKIFFVIFFVFEIQKLLIKFQHTYVSNIYKCWFITFLILSLDIIFEIIFGHNVFGFSAEMFGRISSFFGDELVVGAYYHGFVLIFLSFLINNKSSNYVIIIAIFSVVVVSFLIGERSNFIKLFISVAIFVTLAFKIDYKIKLSFFVVLLISFITITNFNEEYKYRYYNQIKPLFSLNGYFDFMKESQYGAHRIASYQIFKDNFYFGVGIKNFRNEVGKNKYENKDYVKTDFRVATHPHQVHHEFLSETGIIGYLSFLIFISLSLFVSLKRYFKTKNLYQLSGIIFVITSILPIIPSGSFFSTFTSSIFWFNFALMYGCYNKS